MAGKEIPLNLILQAVNRTSGPLAELQRNLATVKQAAEAAGAAPSQASGIGRLGEGVKTLLGDVTSLVTKFGALGLAAAGGIFAAVKSTATAGAEIEKFRARLNLTADGFTQLQLASGLDPQEFTTAISTFQRGLALARIGKGRLAKALDDEAGGGISPALLRQLKSAKSFEQQLEIAIRAFETLQDAGERAALGKALFGDERLVGTFAKGTVAFTSRRNEVTRLIGPQEEFARTSLELTRGIKDANIALEGAKRAALVAFYPAVKAAVEVSKEFFVDKRPAIAAWAADFGQKLPGRIRVFLATVQEVREKVNATVGALGGWRDIGLAVAAVVGVKLVTSLYGLLAALGAIVANPVGAALVLIGLAALAIYRYWEPISAFFRDLWASIRGPLEQFWGALRPYFDGLWSGIVAVFDAWWSTIKAFLAWTPIGLIVANWTPIKEFMVGLWVLVRQPIFDFFTWVKGVLAEEVLPRVAAVWGRVRDFFRQLWAEISGIFQAAWADIKPIVDRITAAAALPGQLLGKLNFVQQVRELGRQELGTAAPAAAAVPARAFTAEDIQALGEVFAKSFAAGGQSKVRVEFDNLPRGARVNQDASASPGVALDLGYTNAGGL